ncbi:MAG TPA: hypothetical protein DEA08_26735, partial [Planctomycetes bacterium]|nr:hypothetical protein [Planctomycetota bacterium]
EWELAARGPKGRSYPWGEEPAGPARVNGLFKDDPHPLLAPARNAVYRGEAPCGALHMAGNVSELTQDSFLPIPAGELRDYSNLAESPDVVVRGGNWSRDIPQSFFASLREAFNRETRSNIVGFRVALS